MQCNVSCCDGLLWELDKVRVRVEGDCSDHCDGWWFECDEMKLAVDENETRNIIWDMCACPPWVSTVMM